MAQKVVIELVDDMDGGEATQTVSFGLDGTAYEIDLSDENAAALREAVSAYAAKARKVSPRSNGRKPAKVAASSGSSAKEIRARAAENNVEVPERGRIPAEVREAYDAAQ